MKQDERIVKGRNKNASTGYKMLLILMFANIVIKIVLSKDIELFILDSVTLLISLVYYLIASIMSRTLIIEVLDEYCIEERTRIKYNLFMFTCISYLLGSSFVIRYYSGDEMLFSMMYIGILVIPVIYVVFKNMSGGIITTGTKVQKEMNLKELRMYSPIFGIGTTIVPIVGADSIGLTGKIAVFIIFGTISSTIFYYLFRLMYKVGDKAADKNVGTK